MIAIIDYAAGNQTSVARALKHLGIACAITADKDVMDRACGIIFPGVGSAGQAMAHLQATGLDKAIAHLIAKGKPLLGICLGCQILLDQSEEGPVKTLGIIPGRTLAFPKNMAEENGQAAPVPHMGWNNIQQKRPSPLLQGMEPEAEFYFVHSYYVEPPENMVIATTHYGMDFCSIYGRDGLWAVQFHAEKSGPCGLRLLQNFYDYCQGKKTCCQGA